MSRFILSILVLLHGIASIPAQLTAEDATTIRKTLSAHFGNRVFFDENENKESPAIIVADNDPCSSLKKIGALSDAEAKYICRIVLVSPGKCVESLTVIQRCVNLRSLDCSDCEWHQLLTDQVRSLPKLRVLRVHGAGFDDRAMGVVSDKATIEVLMIDGANLSLPAIAKLAKMQNLGQLGISNVDLSKSDCRFLHNHKELHWLILSGTNVGDVCLKELVGCKDLAFLALRGTKISQAAMDRFSAARPDVLVGFEGNLQK